LSLTTTAALEGAGETAAVEEEDDLLVFGEGFG
jgi:hypothetical protein